nr:pseudouridine synthase [Coriobacterium glomerans]
MEPGDRRERPRTMRLQRFLARAGVASRRGSEHLMSAGRVRVNGLVASELGTKVDVGADRVEVDGIEVVFGAPPVYIVLNKPAGYLTTMSDPAGRPCVAELVPIRRFPGLFPVGRLDKDTTGVLLFTTDGDLAQNLLHPSKHVAKTYLARVEGTPDSADLDVLRAGIELDDGPCLPARCRLVERRASGGSSLVELIIREGRKNQVKRMLAAVGHPVQRLVRTSFGGVAASDLAEGEWRELTSCELALLRPESPADPPAHLGRPGASRKES